MSETSIIQHNLHKVFVYGTLKKGEPNHYLMTDPKNGYCRLVGKGMTLKKYPLVIASKYNIPFLLSEQGVGHRIFGEIYEIDDSMLAVLDVLENHPTYYTRREEPIEMLTEDNTTTSGTPKIEHCWMYILCQYRREMLDLVHLANYSSSGDHKMPYVESDDITTVEEIFEKR